MQIPLGILSALGGVFPSKKAEDMMHVFNPDAQQAPQQGVLGKVNGGLSGLLGDPLFNMGIAMMGSNNPSFGGTLAEGVRGAQGAQAFQQQQQDSQLNREYKRAQIGAMQNRPIKPIMRKFALPDGQVQDQQFNPETRRWEPVGSAYNRTAAQGAPSALQEWEMFNTLSPEDQRRFLEMKRAQKTYLTDIQGAPTVVTPGMAGGTPVQQPLSTPDQENAAARDLKAAEAMGSALGKREGNVGAPTPGQDAADKEFAKEYSAFSAGGGFADAEKQIGQLRDALGVLKTQDVTGPLIAATPKALLNVFNPKAVATREAVEEVVQRNLRLVLGAQFTEKEGERLISRAFNPALSEEENVKRVTRLISQMETALQAKKSAAQYFEQNGTLRGWNGKLPSIDDFNPETDVINWEDLP